MPDSNDPVDYTTCCGCHVRTFAAALGIIIVILSILPSFLIFMGKPSAIGSIISLICGIFLIVADIYEKPNCYLPYLIYTVRNSTFYHVANSIF
uniref:Uncharacterized protein n=1 Tax=Panagrolaimus sp. JU765 TaxID=591449 RepID=A0AC34Q3Z0_9BILA